MSHLDAGTLRGRVQARTTLAVLAGALVLAPALAFSQSRPDLTDISSNFSSPIPGPGFNRIDFGVAAAGPGSSWYVNGYYFLYHAANSRGDIEYVLFEPDKITRKGADAKLQQSAFMSVQVTVKTPAAPTFTHGGLVEGCKTSAKVKGGAASWKLACDSSALDALGFTDAQKTAFAQVFGSTSVRVTGRTP